VRVERIDGTVADMVDVRVTADAVTGRLWRPGEAGRTLRIPRDSVRRIVAQRTERTRSVTSGIGIVTAVVVGIGVLTLLAVFSLVGRIGVGGSP
jgi:hypothetical protein